MPEWGETVVLVVGAIPTSMFGRNNGAAGLPRQTFVAFYKDALSEA